jgi:hypothetical protein
VWLFTFAFFLYKGRGKKKKKEEAKTFRDCSPDRHSQSKKEEEQRNI